LPLAEASAATAWTATIKQNSAATHRRPDEFLQTFMIRVKTPCLAAPVSGVP